MELPEKMMNGMDGSRWQSMAPSISTNLKGEEEKNTWKIFIIDVVRLKKN